MPKMNDVSDEILERHHVFVATDNVFQRRARLLQALWREERGLPIEHVRGDRVLRSISVHRLRSVVEDEGVPAVGTRRRAHIRGVFVLASGQESVTTRDVGTERQDGAR